MRKTIRLTVDVEIAELSDSGVRKSVKEIENGLRLYDDDVVDGFVITTNLSDCDNTNDFFIKNYRIVGTEIL